MPHIVLSCGEIWDLKSRNAHGSNYKVRLHVHNKRTGHEECMEIRRYTFPISPEVRRVLGNE